jgi:amino acid transporter
MRSQTLHRKLTWFGVLLLTLSCLSPIVSVFGTGGDVLQHAGTGAAGTFLLGIGVAVVWAVIYAELGSAYPYAGGDYVGVGTILGPWAGIASLTLWTATAGPGTAFLPRTIGVYFCELVPAASPTAVTFLSLVAAGGVALLAVRTSALITGLFLAVEMLAVVALIAVGLMHPARSLGESLLHPLTLGAAGAVGPTALGAMALAAVSAAYATTGGNQAVAFGEELIEPHRYMGHVVMLAAGIGALATAVPVIAVALGAVDLRAVLGSKAPFSTFVAGLAGPLAGHALSAAVIVSLFNALVASLMFYARLLFSLGRDAIFHGTVNAQLAAVHAGSGAPRVATVVFTAITAACCLLGTHTLIVFSSGLTVYSLALVSIAVLVGRRRGMTGQPGYWRSPLYPLAPLLGILLALAFGVADLADAGEGRPSLLLLGAIIAAGLAWHHLVLRRRPGGWTPRIGLPS